jgi:hypothetical protein
MSPKIITLYNIMRKAVHATNMHAQGTMQDIVKILSKTSTCFSQLSTSLMEQWPGAHQTLQ